MEKLLSNKWVLIGGVAIVGLGAFMYMRGSSSETSDDTGATGFSVPFMYGGYGAGVGGGLSGDGSTSGTDNATSLLLALETKKVDNEYSLGLKQIASTELISLKGYDTQKDIAFRDAQSADFAAATQLLSGTIGRAKSKQIGGILRSGVGLKANISGVESSITFGSGTGNPNK